MTLFEGFFAQSVLLVVMGAAEADGPTIRRFQAQPAVGIPPDMSALDRSAQTTRDAAVMAPDPRSVSRAVTWADLALRTIKPAR